MLGAPVFHLNSNLFEFDSNVGGGSKLYFLVRIRCVERNVTLLTLIPFVPGDEESGEELLQKLATRHYYSYTAALGVTVGVGCLLLILNMLIFAGIYYQRDRDRRRQNHVRSSRSNSSPSTETIPMSHRPSSPDSSSRQSPIISRKEKQELPPSYSVMPKSPSRTDVPSLKQDTLKREKPPPPVRTTSNLSGGTVKKRVQIQEISV